MIINTELGAFGSRNQCLDFVRTDWDKQVDKQSINHGQQVFEKMVSGMYLGEIVRTIVLNLMLREILSPRVFGCFSQRNAFPTSFISKAELDATNSSTWENTLALFKSMNISEASPYDCECLHIICSRVSRRSAHLTSAVITSLLRRMGHSNTVIGVDGSVYRCHPHFKSVLNEKISQLLRNMHLEHLNFHLMLSEDGSGRGAALVAALLPLGVSQLTMTECTECKEPQSGLAGQMRACRVCAVTV
jgi:hexokinase